MSEYKCLTVILTNHGVYIIDDSEESFSMDPNNHDQLQCPQRVFSFNYKSIRRLVYGQRLEQRMTIKVQSETADAWWAVNDKLNRS